MTRHVAKTLPRNVMGAMVWLFGAAAAVGQTAATGPLDPKLPVGPLPGGRVIVPTNQVLSPLGTQLEFAGRPVDLALSPDRRFIAVLSLHHVMLIEVASGRIADQHRHAGSSFTGIRFSPDGRRLVVSTIPGRNERPKNLGLHEYRVEPAGKLQVTPPIPLPGQTPIPAGMAFTPDGRRLWVASNLNNSVLELDLETRMVVREIPVGVAPFGVVLANGKVYVSNWGGPRPKPGDVVGPSGSSATVRVDPLRHIASAGSVSVVPLAEGRVTAEIAVGLHPSGMAAMADGSKVFVANANSDTVSVVDTQRDAVVETIPVRPSADLLFGSSPSALALNGEETRLYVALGGANAVGVVSLAPTGSRWLGAFPTGWYPAGLALDTATNVMYVANLKGVGSRDTGWKGKRAIAGRQVDGFNSHDHQGSVSIVPLPADAHLAEHTKTVLENNRLTASISALAPPRKDVPPRPVPERHGEPSLFKHAIYIIKENRTYDQVFGDMPQGKGDPNLCIFGRQVTPNHHKLAEEFVLLDNFYCSGVLSADGHQWTNEAFVTGYLERSFGGFPRSYPYDGHDALAYAPTGFLWDNALAHQKTIRVYGEFVKATVRWKDGERKGTPTFLDCYRDFVEQTGQIEIRARAAIKTIEPYICQTYIGFPGIVPDVYRANEFLKELKAFEARGAFPNLVVMLLPNDHTMGTRPGAPTPAAAVADNDLALGRIVEAISHSKFWKDTCIFVVQDDPQNGFDHIDGHRTVAFVISPYTRRRVVDSTNYNQTSMVRTLELILGLPPMNQFDASATPMTACFTDRPDFTPYKAVPNQIPLDQLNPPLNAIRDPRELHWAKKSLELPLDDIDEADEDTLNRILWFAARRRDDTYPSWAVTLDDGDD